MITHVEIEDGVARLTIPCKGINHAVLIDEEDLHKITGLTWSISYTKGGKKYVTAHVGRKNGKAVRAYMHCLIIGVSDGMCRDHRNGDGLDNRKDNLRPLSSQMNCRNRAKANKNSKSGVRGVSWHKLRSKWVATARVGYVKKHLGLFEDIAQAKKAIEEFWRINGPEHSAA